MTMLFGSSREARLRLALITERQERARALLRTAEWLAIATLTLAVLVDWFAP